MPPHIREREREKERERGREERHTLLACFGLQRGCGLRSGRKRRTARPFKSRPFRRRHFAPVEGASPAISSTEISAELSQKRDPHGSHGGSVEKKGNSSERAPAVCRPDFRPVDVSEIGFRYESTPVGIPSRCSLCVRQLLEKRVSSVHAFLLVPFLSPPLVPPFSSRHVHARCVARVARVWRERVASRESRDGESRDLNVKRAGRVTSRIRSTAPLSVRAIVAAVETGG